MLLIRSIPLTSVTGSNLKYLLPEKQLCIQQLLCSLCTIYNSNITVVMSVDQYENKLRIHSVKVLNKENSNDQDTWLNRIAMLICNDFVICNILISQ